MIQKKICMLGAFAVGKTSLVGRFVKSIFSEKYLTTVGVKIDKKTIVHGDTTVNFMIWDLAGEDEFQKVQLSYLRGAAGYLLVVDGTRKETLDTAVRLIKNVETAVGKVPHVLLLNKADLMDHWEIDMDAVDAAIPEKKTVYKTSAKTGDHVEDAFRALAARILEAQSIDSV